MLLSIFIPDINAIQEKSDEALRKQSEIVAMGKNIAIEKERIEEILTEASRPLNEAKQVVIELNRDAVTDLLKMETPPEYVEVFGECFSYLKGIRDTSWKNVRNIVLEETFFENLLEINCDLIMMKQASLCKSNLKVSNLSSATRFAARKASACDINRIIIISTCEM